MSSPDSETSIVQRGNDFQTRPEKGKSERSSQKYSNRPKSVSAVKTAKPQRTKRAMKANDQRYTIQDETQHNNGDHARDQKGPTTQGRRTTRREGRSARTNTRKEDKETQDGNAEGDFEKTIF